MTTERPADAHPAPGWVESGAEEVRGLDLLGLRAPVMRIGNALLDGITTITPSVRYMSFVPWITWLYWRRKGTDSRKAYLEFARRIEAAIALGNLAYDPTVTGLIGADGSRGALDDAEGVPLNLQVVALAANIYSVPAQQLGLLSVGTDTQVPHLNKARGMPLAETVEAEFRKTALGQRLCEGELPDRVPLNVLREFGKAAHVRTFPADERGLLLDAILPHVPEGVTESNRLASYVSFLARATQGQARGEYRAFLGTAVRAERACSAALEGVLDGWALYLVRDALAVTHEYALAAIIARLPRPAGGGPIWVSSTEAVNSVLSDATAMQEVLADLDLISPEERWEDLRIRDLRKRVEARTREGEVVARGLRRWEGGLDEERLIGVVRNNCAGAPAVLPIAWLLSERRTGPGVRDHLPWFAALSPRDGFSRLGVEQVLLPALQRYEQADAKLMDVVADLLAWTVEQHLRTAWSRLAVDFRKDVALLLVDGNRWTYRKDFRPGQTDSRLSQVGNWLRQLGLMDDTGATDVGRAALARGLATLEGKAAS